VDAGDIPIVVADHEGKLFSVLWVVVIESRNFEIDFDDPMLQLAQ
jgi:hypothetical protein